MQDLRLQLYKAAGTHTNETTHVRHLSSRCMRFISTVCYRRIARDEMCRVEHRMVGRKDGRVWRHLD